MHACVCIYIILFFCGCLAIHSSCQTMYKLLQIQITIYDLLLNRLPYKDFIYSCLCVSVCDLQFNYFMSFLPFLMYLFIDRVFICIFLLFNSNNARRMLLLQLLIIYIYKRKNVDKMVLASTKYI